MKTNNKEFTQKVMELQEEFLAQKDLEGKKEKTLRKLETEAYVEAVFEAIDNIAEGMDGKSTNKLYTPIGDFWNKHVEARKGRNPKTKEEIEIPAKDVLGYKTKVKY